MLEELKDFFDWLMGDWIGRAYVVFVVCLMSLLFLALVLVFLYEASSDEDRIREIEYEGMSCLIYNDSGITCDWR